MGHTTLAVLQTPWDCRWSQPGHRLTHVDEQDQPEGAWVCTRPTPVGSRRTVSEEECATCRHWLEEPRSPAPRSALEVSWIARSGLRLVASDSGPSSVSDIAPAVPASGRWLEVAKHALQRALLVTAGLMLLALGVGMAVTVFFIPQGIAL